MSDAPARLVRPDGLTIVAFSQRALHWWCKFCDGKNAPRNRRGRVKNIDDIWAEWDVHRRLDRHRAAAQEWRRDRELADNVARAIHPNMR